jgi:hypothetical protein
MKIDSNTFLKMKTDLSVIIKSYNLNYIKFEDLTDSDIFAIWSFVYNNRKYTESNKNVKFIDGMRLLPLDIDFNYYPCDTNDNTLLTALKKAIKDILN